MNPILRIVVPRGALVAVILNVWTPCVLWGQSLSLDDAPAFPFSTPAWGAGFGAEDQFGLIGPPLAPSPSLGLLGVPAGAEDGTIFTPAVPPALTMTPGPGFPLVAPPNFSLDAFSRNHTVSADQPPPIRVMFSPDRTTTGIGGLGAEAAAGQAPGDIYTSTLTFAHPAVFAGFGAGAGVMGFGGALPTAFSGFPGGASNTLTFDDSVFGLTVTGVPGTTTPPGVAVPPPSPPPVGGVAGSHDNLDAFDLASMMPVAGVPAGVGAYPFNTYFSINPDEAAGLPPPASGGDIFRVPPGGVMFTGLPWAPAPALGLDFPGPLLMPNVDSVDALVVFDQNQIDHQFAEMGIDVALFSLAPGSAALGAYMVVDPSLGGPRPLGAGDVFWTDFSGNFFLYASETTDLGIGPGGMGAPGGMPLGPSNIDALEIVPEPTSSLLLAIAGLLTLMYRRRP